MNGTSHGLVLDLSWVLPAPRGLVFAMLTEPAELSRWWGPQGFTIPAVEVDLRPGGRYRFVMQPPDGEAFHLSGEFLEVEPPHRLAYTFAWEEPEPDDRETIVVLTLEAVEAGTELTLAQGGFATQARLALHRDGWSDSVAKLRDLVARGV